MMRRNEARLRGGVGAQGLSTEFGVSRERVRQIEVRTLHKILRAIRKQAIDEKLIGEMA